MELSEILERAAAHVQESVPPIQNAGDLMKHAAEVIAYNVLTTAALKIRLAELREYGEQAEIPEPESDPEFGLTAEGTGFTTPEPLDPRVSRMREVLWKIADLGGSITRLPTRDWAVNGPAKHAEHIIDLATQYRDLVGEGGELLLSAPLTRQPVRRRPWTTLEDDQIRRFVEQGVHWSSVEHMFAGRTPRAVEKRFHVVKQAVQAASLPGGREDDAEPQEGESHGE